MLAKTNSLRIEAILSKINPFILNKSDEILRDPYDIIVSALEHRVPQEKLDKFKLYYQGIREQSLQELIDCNYDIEQLIKNLKELIVNN